MSSSKMKLNNIPKANDNQTISDLASLNKTNEIVAGTHQGKTKKKISKKITHKVFSFWALREDIARWQAYYKIIGEFKVFEELGKAALDEYMINHPIPEDKKGFYDFMLDQELATMKKEKAEAENKYS